MQPNEATAGPALPSASARNARIGLFLVVATAAVATALVLATILPGGLSGPRADAQQADAVAAAVAASFRTNLSKATGIAADLAADPAVAAHRRGQARGPSHRPRPHRSSTPPIAWSGAGLQIFSRTPATRCACRRARSARRRPGSAGPIPALPDDTAAVLPVDRRRPGQPSCRVARADREGLAKGGSVHRLRLARGAPRRCVGGGRAGRGRAGARRPGGARIAHADSVPTGGQPGSGAGGTGGAGGTSGAGDASATVTASVTRSLQGLPAGFPAWSLVVRLPIPTAGGTGEPMPVLLVARGDPRLHRHLRCVPGAASGRPPREHELELQRKFVEVAEQAYVDVMTGLGNQRAFQVECDRQLEFVRRGRLPLTLVILDLDDFKRINDTDGHKVGDELLAAFAQDHRGLHPAQRPRLPGRRRRVRDPHAGDRCGWRRDLTRRLLASALEPPAGNTARRRAISFSGGIAEASAQDRRPGRAVLAGRRGDVLVEAPRAHRRSRSSTRTSTRCPAG